MQTISAKVAALILATALTGTAFAASGDGNGPGAGTAGGTSSGNKGGTTAPNAATDQYGVQPDSSTSTNPAPATVTPSAKGLANPDSSTNKGQH